MAKEKIVIEFDASDTKTAKLLEEMSKVEHDYDPQIRTKRIKDNDHMINAVANFLRDCYKRKCFTFSFEPLEPEEPEEPEKPKKSKDHTTGMIHKLIRLERDDE